MKKYFLFFAFIAIILSNVMSSVTRKQMNRTTPVENLLFQKEFVENTLDFDSEIKDNVLFRHSTFDDFSGGTVSNSGHNLFISHDGQIRFINWFDLNNDGYPEIVSVNDHNPFEVSDAFIYYNRPNQGFKSLMPPKREFTPGFQELEWMQESLKHIDMLPSLGGGYTLVDDLNNDGYPEILFSNFVHGWSDNHYPVTLYWGGVNGVSKTNVSYLPSLTASGLASADLNGNGYKDIIMANVGREAYSTAYARTAIDPKDRQIGADESISYIYWQEAWGFSEENRSELPTEYALDVSVADFDQDGHPDVVFLQAGVPGSIRLFYGDKEGVNQNEFIDIEVLAPAWGTYPRKLLVADLNGDGKPDIFVPSVGEDSQIFWNSEKGFSQDNQTLISCRSPLSAAAEDLSGNGYNDLVVVNYDGPSYIYWNNTDGFSEDRRTELPTNAATSVAIADLNKDSFYDIVFSNSKEEDSYDNSSFIYWGSEDGYHPADRDDLWGFGAVDVAIADFNNNGLNDIFLMNRQSGITSPQHGSRSYDPIDLFVYWGNPISKYSVSSMSSLKGVRPLSSVSATDLTGNGFADLVTLTDGGRTVTVYYGDQNGYSNDKTSHYETKIRGLTPTVADFNKDGFLDIVIESALTNKNEIAILYGNENGFDDVQVYSYDDDFEANMRTMTIGDVDDDGNLDLVFGSHGFIKIIYGNNEGTFESNRVGTIKTDMYSTKISLADFNGNGLLDIFGHNHTPANRGGEYSVYSAIYWNKNGFFSGENRLELPSHGSHSGTIADVNKDGNLDILIANYNAQHSRNLDSFIYWGGDNGSYHPDSLTRLPSFSALSNLVLDLDGDGINDIVVYNHSKSNRYAGSNAIGGMHSVNSYIYWGTEDGWDITNRDEIPTFGPHGRLVAEAGDIMNRGSYEDYTSAPISLKEYNGQYNLKVESSHNFRQSVKVYIKSADNIKKLEQAEWKELNLTDRTDDYFLYDGFLSEKDVFIKYKLRLDTGETGTGPIIKAVEMYR